MPPLCVFEFWPLYLCPTLSQLLENASLLASQGAERVGQRGPGPVRRSCGAKADGQQIGSPVGEDTGEIM